MTSNDAVPSPSGLRTGCEEETDFQSTVKHILSETWQDWPNEAGFAGLKEVRGPIEIPVTGKIPTWACGTLFRTGPGQWEIEGTPKGTFHMSHWFDGLAHTHRFDIIQGRESSDMNSSTEDSASDDDRPVRVFYASRRQSEALADDIRKHGRRRNMSFAQRRDPCVGMFGKLVSAWRLMGRKSSMKELENISVVVHLDPPGLADKMDGEREKLQIGSSVVDMSSLTSKREDRQLRPATWITTDTPSFLRINPETLEPIAYTTQDTLHPALKGPMSCSHGQRCPKTGDMFNFNTEMGRVGSIRVFRVSAETGESTILATIRRQGLPPAYIHSFWLTDNYVIICVPSTHLAVYGLKILWTGNLLDGIEPFSDTKRWRWFVVDRSGKGGVVAEFESDAGFFFHTVNAFEVQHDAPADLKSKPTNGSSHDADNATPSEPVADDRRPVQPSEVAETSIYCDVIAYETTEIMYGLYYNILMNRDRAASVYWGDERRVRSSIPRLMRFRLRLPAQVTSSPQTSAPCPTPLPQVAETEFTILGPHVGELPTINPAYACRSYRYIYSLANRGFSTLSDTVVKTDILSRDALMWDAPHGHSPGEAIFVARPKGREFTANRPRSGGTIEDALAEDDGILLTVVLDGNKGSSYLLCLDARTMTELGRAEVGFAIGHGFHGIHTK